MSSVSREKQRRLLFDLPRGAVIAGGGSAVGAVALTGVPGVGGDSGPVRTIDRGAHVRTAESMGIQAGAPRSMSSLLSVRAFTFEPLPAPVAPRQMSAALRILKKAGFKPDDVAEFQTAVGLSPSGVIDTQTYRALQKVQQRMKSKGRIGPGQAGKHIRTIKARLKILGYDPGPINMIYDQQTALAVKKLRADQKDLTNGSGLMTPRSQRVLRREVRLIQHAPYHSRVKNTREHRRAEARALAVVSRGEGVGIGARGPTVAYLKQHLAAAGFEAKGPKDQYDERTDGMVRHFQKKTKKLDVTGRVDRATWLELRRAKMEAKNSTSPPQKIGERSKAVQRSKKQLRELGYKPGFGTTYTRQMDREVNKFRSREGLGGRGGGVTERVKKELNTEIREKRGIKATGYINGRAFSIRIVKVQGYWVEVRTAKAYERMRKAAARDGVAIRINSGFRTMERQRELYNGWINRLPGYNPANPPGFSNHQSGIALDLNTTGPSDAVGSGPVYNWLARNAGRFGFQRIPSEHWHWEYRR